MRPASRRARSRRAWRGSSSGWLVAQRGQLGQGPARRRPRARAAASRARRASSRRASQRAASAAAVGQVGEGRAAPQGEGVVEEGGRLGRVAVGQRPRALRRQPLEAVQVDVVAARRTAGSRPPRRRTRRVPERPPQPADQRLQRAGRVGGRVAVPHLVDEHSARAPSARAAARARSAARAAALRRAATGVPSSRSGLGGAEDARSAPAHCLRRTADRARFRGTESGRAGPADDRFLGGPSASTAVARIRSWPPLRHPQEPRP